MLVANVNGRITPFDPAIYIRQGKNGWVLCGPDEAEAVVVDSERCALSADHPVVRDPIYDDNGQLVDPAPPAPVAYIYDDGGDLTHGLVEDTREHTVQIVDLELGAVDLADAISVNTVDTEAALVDLADMVMLLSERIEQLETAEGE